MEWLHSYSPIAQAPISIDVDKNNIEESLCTPDPVISSKSVASVTGAYKTIFTSPRRESLHKEELLVSQAERYSSLYQVSTVIFR